MNRRTFWKSAAACLGVASLPTTLHSVTDTPRKQETLDGLNLDGYSEEDKEALEALHDESGKIILHPYDVFEICRNNINKFTEINTSRMLWSSGAHFHFDRVSDLSQIQTLRSRFHESIRVAPVSKKYRKEIFSGTE